LRQVFLIWTILISLTALSVHGQITDTVLKKLKLPSGLAPATMPDKSKDSVETWKQIDLVNQMVQLIGTYYRTADSCCSSSLILRKDLTFALLFRIDWDNNSFSGEWSVKHKTLYLHTYGATKIAKWKIKKATIRGLDSFKLKYREFPFFKKNKWYYKNEPIRDWK
jgi:hypothetical protein